MVELGQFQQVLWAVNVAVGLALAGVLVVRKNYRVYPAFSFYIFLNLTQAALFFIMYRQWGFSSAFAWPIAWSAQAIVVCARALAVAEVCRHLLARYPGIWALAWRLLLSCAALVFLFALPAMKHGWFSVLTTAQLDLDLAIAVAIVALLVFARFYGVVPKSPLRSLAVGFCLYSCFSALNNTIFQRFFDYYAPLWNLMDMLAFLASLLLWTWALRVPQTEAESKEILLPSDLYQSLAPEINLRLRTFNDQLSRFWKVEPGRS